MARRDEAGPKCVALGRGLSVGGGSEKLLGGMGGVGEGGHSYPAVATRAYE